MKRFTKVCLWIFGVCLVLGLLLVSVSWALGFRGWHPLRRPPLSMEAWNQSVEGDIRSLRFSVRAGTLVVEEGERFEIVEAARGTTVESRVENGVWILEAEGTGEGSVIGGFAVDNEGIYWKADTGEVHVTIPAGVVLEQADFSADAGVMELSGLSCGRMTVDSRAGSVALSAQVEECLEVFCEMSDVSGVLTGSEYDYRVDADCSIMGSITAGSYELGGIGILKDSFARGDEERELKLSCETGSIELSFSEEGQEE